MSPQNIVCIFPATIVIDARFPLFSCFHVFYQFMFHTEDVNCILTDWRGGSSGFYTDAVNNVRIVGAELVYLVNLLEVKVSMECECRPIICTVKAVFRVAPLDFMQWSQKVQRDSITQLKMS